MATRKKKKLKRLALFCGAVAALYFLFFFSVHLFDFGMLLPEDWMNDDLHYIVACFAIICFLLYISIVIRIYTRQAVPNPRFSGYMIFGVGLGVLFVLWSVGLLMTALNLN
ncbi:MAG: hypothetical protein EOP49_01050 [Sphingobacteriales bacterium]|nr:MAG: hypothetical protein EOP49_01050 [Sphingobacteriales bacterium]